MKKNFINNNITFTFTFTEQIPYTDKQNLQDYYNNTNRNLQKNIFKNSTPLTYMPSQPSPIHLENDHDNEDERKRDFMTVNHLNKVKDSEELEYRT